MRDKPYSIYVDKRPVRIAFLVNNSAPAELIDAIISYNRTLWGGRFNQIILTDGATLNESDWDFLKEYDPDFIKSLTPLKDELIKKISLTLSPLSLEVNEPERGVQIQSHPISIIHNLDNFKKLETNRTETKLVIFRPAKDIDPTIREFLFRNFGIYHDLRYQASLLPEDKVRVFEVDGLITLNKALIQLSDWRDYYAYQYPGQFCALPNTAQDISANSINDKFSIIIGNSIHDLVSMWNHPLSVPQWLRTRLTQLWVPPAFLNDPLIQSGITAFINNFARQQGGQDHGGLRILSSSLSITELESIAKSQLFREGIHVHKITHHFDTLQYPNYNLKLTTLMYLPPTLELHSAHNDVEYLQINDPVVPQGSMLGEEWMADLYIEFENKEDNIIRNSNRWWQLPKRNALTHHIFNKPARINRYHSFSVLMSRRDHSLLPNNESHLEVNLPTTNNIFWKLFTKAEAGYFSSDPQSKIANPRYRDIKISAPGQQFSGVIKLFGNINSAAHYLSKKSWRSIFALLSNINSGKIEIQTESLINLLKKLVEQYNIDPFNKEPVLHRIAKWIIDEVKKRPYGGKSMSFDELLKVALQKETSKAKIVSVHKTDLKTERQKLVALLTLICNQPLLKNPSNPQSMEYLQRDMQDLLNSNVLIAGVDVRCPQCGQMNWIQISHLKQTLECQGCNYKFHLEAEPVWKYRINTLIGTAITQGLTPLILTLAELQSDARNCFLFVPSIELYEKYDQAPVAEIDLACIQDGKFIIGEIKEHSNLFQPNDFKKIFSVAQKIRPDMVVFGSMDEKPDNQTKIHIKDIRSKLEPFGVLVSWVQFPSYYFRNDHE